MDQFSGIHYYKARRSLVLDILDSHQNPLSLQELKKEYKEKHATDIPFSDVNDDAIHEWLTQIESIGTASKNNQQYYFIQKPIMNEVSSTVSNESKRKTSSPLICQTVKRSRSAPENDEPTTPTKPRQARSVRFKEQPNKNSKSRSKSENRPQRLMGAPNLYGSLLIGDDFFLGVSIYKLGYSASKQRGRLQSGFCMSGMTIKDAMYKIKEIEDDRHKTAIIYVGSIDIAMGRELIEMMQDMTLLMQACAEKNIKPILCTLAILPNYLLGNRKETLKGFNMYITNNPFGIASIDLNKCFKNGNSDDFLPHYYLEIPRYVSGFNKMLVLWSKDGRDRVYDMLIKNLGMALVATGNISHNYI
ncbi:maternal effect protein oskar [Chironomus tepperi]|uniref:maternal effect protein oskar n=1 Tax=Chironomus tepperi TaxID=113505 RepID=UPI00391F9121